MLFNVFPCYRRTGVKVTYISSDFHEVRIKLPLNWKTRGYNGTGRASAEFGPYSGQPSDTVMTAFRSSRKLVR